MIKRFLIILIISVQGLPSILAQVTDDSTKMVYGPETSIFTTEQDIKNNITTYQYLDTTLRQMHLWEPVEKERYYLQNLGAVGSANQSIFYEAPDVIGKRSGFNVYDYYIKTPDDFRYFDTKSPYTNMRSIIGGNDRAYIGVDFSRNVNENWNVGFNFNRWTIDKQVGLTANRSQNTYVLSHSYDIYSDYQTPNRKYRLLVNFARTYHKVNETGGVQQPQSDTVLITDRLFGYRDANINLRSFQGGELRQQYHIYQQYRLSKILQVYHVFDRSKQMNKFTGSLTGDDAEFFDQILIRPDSTVDLTNYRFLQNEVGIKGDLAKLFYRFYVKRKDIRYSGKYLESVNALAENYAGGYARLSPKEGWDLEANAEFELAGNYRLGGTLKIPFFEVSALSMQFASPFLNNLYLGNHDFWINNFGSEQVQQLSGKFTFNWKDKFTIQPKAAIKVVTNHLYFDTEAKPRQGNGAATMLHPGVEVKSRFGYFNINTDYVYTTIEGGDANLFRIPEHFVTVNLFYERDYQDKLTYRVGIDLHAKSAYFADDYDPVTQQFFLQNNFEIPSHFFGDVYASFKVGNASFFVKYRHFNAGLNAPGYFTAPFYTGQEGVVDIGVSWSFFD